jgi:hypothetical protein
MIVDSDGNFRNVETELEWTDEGRLEARIRVRRLSEGQSVHLIDTFSSGVEVGDVAGLHEFMSAYLEKYPNLQQEQYLEELYESIGRRVAERVKRAYEAK